MLLSFNQRMYKKYKLRIEQFCSTLNIPIPTILFRKSKEIETTGYFNNRTQIVTILISPHSSFEYNCTVIYHELTHFWQLLNGRDMRHNKEQLESEVKTIVDNYLLHLILWNNNNK